MVILFFNCFFKHHNCYKQIIQYVPPIAENSCPVRDPHLQKHISNLEKIQRNEARYVKADCIYSSSERNNSIMVKQLGLSHIEERMFKSIKTKSAVPSRNMLVPAHGQTALTNVYLLEPTDEYGTFFLSLTL